MSNLSVSESRVKIGATPSDHVINLDGGVTRVTADTSIKNYANPNTLEFTLASLKVDSTNSINFKIYVITQSTSITVSSAISNANILVVGGGGAGGSDNSGGGGAGGLVFAENISISSGTYPITVGSGGTGNVDQNTGQNGGNSTALGLTALGGGGGAAGDTGGEASDGGSGGGGEGEGNRGPGSGLQPGTNSGFTGLVYDAGHDGGLPMAGDDGSGGGGGGAGEVGANATSSKSEPGNGGDGLDMSSYFGNSVGDNGYFAGGGAGGVGNASGVPPEGYGTGGLGGGGDHGKGNAAGAYYGGDGLPNTGGGGAAGSWTGSTMRSSGDGGSGIVIIAYPSTQGDLITGHDSSYNEGGSVYTDLSSQNLVELTYNSESGFTLPQPIINTQRINSFKTYSNSAISGLITRIQSVSNISDYELDGSITLTNTRTITTGASSGGDGDGGSEPVSSGPIQTWY